VRRYSPLKPSSGTRISPEIRLAIYQRDGGCVGRKCFEGECAGALEIDHVRASHGIGLKSRTTLDNLVALCGVHHRWKTEHGREARPILLAYLELIDDPHAAHVDVVAGCEACFAAVSR